MFMIGWFAAGDQRDHVNDIEGNQDQPLAAAHPAVQGDGQQLGAQAQADWAEYRRLMIGGRSQTGYCFHLQLSWSRFGAGGWSPRKDQLSWQQVVNM